MKLNLLVALIGSTQAIRFIDNVDELMNNLVLDSTGVDIDAMQGPNHHRKTWPLGVTDDSTLDNTVLNLGPDARKKAEKEQGLKYLDVPQAS